MTGIIRSLDDMPPDLRHAVQFCAECETAGFPYYRVCVRHEATAGQPDDVRSLMRGFAASRPPGCPYGSPPGCRCANCYEAEESQP